MKRRATDTATYVSNDDPFSEPATLMAAIVDSSDDAIVSKYLDGTIGSWNRGAERLYGYTSEEAIGQNMAMLVPTDRGDELAFILTGIRGDNPVRHFDTQRVRKDGWSWCLGGLKSIKGCR